MGYGCKEVDRLKESLDAHKARLKHLRDSEKNRKQAQKVHQEELKKGEDKYAHWSHTMASRKFKTQLTQDQWRMNYYFERQKRIRKEEEESSKEEERAEQVAEANE